MKFSSFYADCTLSLLWKAEDKTATQKINATAKLRRRFKTHGV